MSDDDLEARLRRALAARADQAPPPGPVEQRTMAAVRQGRRRRRPGWFGAVALRPVAVAASVLAIVGATAGGVALVHNLTQGPRPGAGQVSGSSRTTTSTSTATTSKASIAAPTSLGASAPPSVSGSASGASTGAPAGPKTGPAPKGLAVADLTFVSTDAGWALGTVATCAHTPCTSLVRTTDGGNTWVGLAPPVVDLAGTSGCTGSNCVSAVRFANASVGYLYGPRTLYLTIDGGAHWTRQAGGADALEIAAGNVLRVTTTHPDCRPACTYLVQTSTVGGTNWRTVLTTPTGSGNGVALVRAGRSAFVQVYAHTAGGAQSAHSSLYSSTDGGQAWTSPAEPCPQLNGAAVEYDASALAPTPSGSVAVLCRPRSPGHDPFVATSSQPGRPFLAGTPNAELSAPIASTTAGVVFATATSTGSSGQLLRSTDGGKTWTVVVTAPSTSTFGGFAFGFLGFENATTGRWVSASDPYTIWTTRNAGATWTKHSF